MIRNIIVPVDFSEASLNALECAGFIARKQNSRVQLLHVQETDETYLDKGSLPMPVHARSVADAVAAGFCQKQGIQPSIVFRTGFAAPTVVKAAFELKAELIVLGAHGASGMREQFIGSTAYYIVKYANCPVLIIPEGGKWPGFSNILFPLRTSFGSYKRYEFIKALCGDRDANLEIFALSIDKDPVEGQALELMSQRLNTGNRKNNFTLSLHHSEHKNISKEVLDRADRMQADLVVLSPAVDVVNKQFFVGPFCQRIIHNAKVPVLYVR